MTNNKGRRVEIYTDIPRRLWDDAIAYSKGEVRYDSRADASAGFDLGPALRRGDGVVKLRVRDLGETISAGSYAMVREACLSATVFLGIDSDSIFVYGPSRGIDIQRLRGEVALDIDMEKHAVERKETRFIRGAA